MGIVVILALILHSHPTIHQGLSAYQIMSENWTGRQCSALIAVMREQNMTEIGILWGGFGSSSDCIKRVKRQIGPRWWVHLSNENRRARGAPMSRWDLVPDLSYARYNRLAAGNNAGLRRKIRGRISAIRRLLGPALGGISTGLEHSFSKRANAHIARVIRENIEQYDAVVVDNPLFNSDFINGAYCELHGYTDPTPINCRSRCIRNPDGDGIDHPLAGPGGYYRAAVSETRSWFGASVVNSCISLHWLPRWQARGANFTARPWERNFDFNRGDTEIINLITKGLFL